MSHANLVYKGLNQAFKTHNYNIWVISLSEHLTATFFFFLCFYKEEYDLLLTVKQIRENLWTHPPRPFVSHTMALPSPYTKTNQSQFISNFPD